MTELREKVLDTFEDLSGWVEVNGRVHTDFDPENLTLRGCPAEAVVKF